MPAPSLDDRQTFARLDPEGLLGRIAGLPDQMREAWDAARSLKLPARYADADRVVVLGMGGSGIGGALLQALALDLKARAAVHVVRGYALPAWVDERTLVIASSNSGNTEEVVAAFGAALDSGAHCIAVTAGGRVMQMAQDRDVPVLRARWDAEPRAALGWSFIAPLAIVSRLGLAPDVSAMLDGALDELRAYAAALDAGVPEQRNEAKQLARRLHGRLPVIIGAEALAPAAYRWRTQYNENAKVWAVADELPEMNHNAPLGYGAPAGLLPLLHVVLLRHDAMHPRNQLRVAATYDELRAHGIAAEIVDAAGASVLAQQLRAVQLGDFASYYLGILNEVNPSSMAALERLKKLLAESEG